MRLLENNQFFSLFNLRVATLTLEKLCGNIQSERSKKFQF
jgi:hypothetical protein